MLRTVCITSLAVSSFALFVFLLVLIRYHRSADEQCFRACSIICGCAAIVNVIGNTVFLVSVAALLIRYLS